MSRITKSKHADIRISQRCDLKDVSDRTLIKLAYIKGLTLKHFKGKVEKYMLEKMNGFRENGKNRVVLYRGYLFIFNHLEKMLITMYPLPDDIKQEYERQMKIKEYSKNGQKDRN